MQEDLASKAIAGAADAQMQRDLAMAQGAKLRNLEMMQAMLEKLPDTAATATRKRKYESTIAKLETELFG